MIVTVETVTEWCPHCEYEAELPYEFKAHVCPNEACKEVILPCAQCVPMDCANCPLEKELN